MFNYLSVKERLLNEQKKNAALEAKQEKTEAECSLPRWSWRRESRGPR